MHDFFDLHANIRLAEQAPGHYDTSCLEASLLNYVHCIVFVIDLIALKLSIV